MDELWPIRLFKKSVLKQHKYQEITNFLGPTDRLSCLDIGSDNGVISYLLRKRGGLWKSADLNEKTVECIRELVGENVFQIDGKRTPFGDHEFDRVVIIDFLEHIPGDREFMNELYRIVKPKGELILNVPHIKNSLLRKWRIAIGQTDALHGHVRPGYTTEGLKEILGDKFTLISYHTYSKFFSEFIDTVMTYVLGRLKKEEAHTSKGVVVDQKDMKKFEKNFKLYSFIYPVVWMWALLDHLLFFLSGYMLIAKAVKKGQVISRKR